MSTLLSSLGVETTIAVFGGKWRPLIVLRLITQPQHYGELLRTLPGLSRKVLTQHLRELETENIIDRTVKHSRPPRVLYSLTKYGNSAIPLLDFMCKWGHVHAQLYPSSRTKTTKRRARVPGEQT